MKHSLTGRSNFKRLYRQGVSWSGGGARIRYIIEASEAPRFAVSVSKTVGNAVIRNRIRRRWRVAVKQASSGLPAGIYQVMIREACPATRFSGAVGVLADLQRHLTK